MKFNIYFAIVAQLLLFSASAQVNNLSPYTRYALGDLQLSSSTQFQTMGHNFSTYMDAYVINANNPASYSLANKPVFDVSFKASFLTLTGNETSQSDRDVTITGFKFMFPLIADKMGMSMGLLPYSSSGYFINDIQNDPNIGEITYEYEGSGGVNKAYFGVGGKILGNDSLNVMIGANGVYLFGTSNKTRRAILPTDANYFNISSINKLSLSGFTAEASVMVNLLPKQLKNIALRFGATMALGGDINGKQTELNRTFKFTSFGTKSYRDTLSFVDAGRGSVSLPVRMNYGLGVVLKEKLYVGINYTSEDWSKYKENFNGASVGYSQLKSSNAFSIGLEYTPQKGRLLSNTFWRTVNYRLGARTEQSYLSLENDHLTIQSVSGGFGLPLLRSKSLTTFNIGVEVGARKGNSVNIVNENFVNIYLGMTFVPNKIDRWFVKRKYD